MNNDMEQKKDEQKDTQNIKANDVENNAKVNGCKSIFVTEEDVFEVLVEFYKKSNKIYVKNLDDDFNDKEIVEKISFTIKYPSQADVEYITANFYLQNNSNQEIGIFELMKLEMIRFMALIRKWSLSENITNEALFNLNPKIVKSIFIKIREEIGMDGIL